MGRVHNRTKRMPPPRVSRLPTSHTSASGRPGQFRQRHTPGWGLCEEVENDTVALSNGSLVGQDSAGHRMEGRTGLWS
jgi:hypothetical protein